MFKMLGAAVAAVSLACAGSASAAVLLQKTGDENNSFPFLAMDELWPFLTEKGSAIEIVLDFTHAPDTFATPYMRYWSYRTYPDGWQEPVPTDELFEAGGSGSARTWDWSATASNLTMQIRQSDYACQDWVPGTTCKWETPVAFLFGLSADSDLTWSLTVNSVDLGSAVPEPATWLMLIAGFGLAGAALRRRQAAMLQNRPI